MPRKDIEARRAYEHQRYLDNCERMKAQAAAYRKAHPDKIKEWNAKNYAANAEKNRSVAAAYRAAHPDELRAYHAAYRAAHRGEKREYFAERYRTHRDEYLASFAEWRRTHRDENSHRGATYRARLAGNGGSHTLQEWREKCALLGNVCFYCGEARPLTRDHKIPITRGGTDDITNIVPSCQSCNSRKRTMTAREFLVRRRRVA